MSEAGEAARKGGCLVLLSGGLDSTACAAFLLGQDWRVRGLFVDYGQLARVHERTAARAIAEHYGFPLDEVGVVGVASTVGEIPGRNAFLLSTAVLATGGQPSTVAIGVHSGTTYFDCSARFFSSIHALIAECTDGAVQVVAPFVEWTKKQIFDYCEANGVPTAMTYSCEAGVVPECGACLSCRDRARLRSSP